VEAPKEAEKPGLDMNFVQGITAPILWTSPVYFGKNIFSLAVSNLGWATLPLNDGFNPEDGFVGCDRQGNHLPSGGRKRKKAEVALFRTASALLYFQSLNISSRALSIAAFRLFSMILNSSASNTEDCFFFFRFFSSAVISLPSPHLKY